MKKISVYNHTIHAPFFFHGMRESEEKWRAYETLDGFFKKYQWYLAGHDMICKPEVNRAYGAFVLYSREKDYGIRKLFLNWNGAENHGLYPSYDSQVASFVTRNKPIVVQKTSDTTSYHGYFRALLLDTIQIGVFLPQTAQAP